MNANQQVQLGDLRRGLVEIRDRLALADGPDVLDELRRDLDRLIERFDHEVAVSITNESALQRFERLQPIDTALDRLMRRWQDFRSAMGEAAAVEIIATADLYASWLDSWGQGLIEGAWGKRDEIEKETSSARGGSLYQQPLLDQGVIQARLDTWRRPGSGADNLLLVLDLRYGANLPLAQIAELFGLSTAAVQSRINMFEAGVVEDVARAAIERQVPTGWQLVPARRSAGGDFYLQRMPRQRGTSEIMLEIRYLRSDRESAGRPRKVGALRRSGRTPGILVIIFFEGARVVYVPMSQAVSIGEPAVLSPIQLADIASEHGFAVLGDAITAELAGFVGPEGG